MGSSNAIEEPRLSASEVSGSQPRHRAVPDEDQGVRPAVAPRDFIDAARRVRNPQYRSTLGVDNWPDDSLTMPGIARPMAVVDPLTPLPADVVPAPPYFFESAHPDSSPGVSPGEQAVAIEEPAAALAGAAPRAAESSEDKGDGPLAPATEQAADPRVTLQRRIAAFVGTKRGTWIVAGVGAVVALIALCVVLGLRSKVATTTEVTQTSNDAPATTSSGPAPSYPSPTPSDPNATTTGPAQVAPTPWQPSDSQAATLPPAGADAAPMPMPAMPPPAPMPAATNDPMLDPDPTDPELGPDQMQPAPPQDQAGLAPRRTRPEDRVTPPRKAGPLGGLDSLTGPRSSDPGAAERQPPSKSSGGDLAGLGHGL